MDNGKQTKIVLSSTVALIGILRREVGLSWIPLFIKALFTSGKLFARTRWAGDTHSEEGRFLKPMSLICALYAGLLEKKGLNDAMRIIDHIITNMAIDFDFFEAGEHRLVEVEDPYIRWSMFHDKMMLDGAGKFNIAELVTKKEHKIHLKISRCVYHDFFTDIGFPELTRFICHSDILFHDAVFKEFMFHRNGSWENTIAHDYDACDYVWEKRRGNEVAELLHDTAEEIMTDRR